MCTLYIYYLNKKKKKKNRTIRELALKTLWLSDQ
jgi:hypothetical protein